MFVCKFIHYSLYSRLHLELLDVTVQTDISLELVKIYLISNSCNQLRYVSYVCNTNQKTFMNTGVFVWIRKNIKDFSKIMSELEIRFCILLDFLTRSKFVLCMIFTPIAVILLLNVKKMIYIWVCAYIEEN